MYGKGKILSFNDIFEYVPKTVVATDLGKRVGDFNKMMDDIRKFTLEDLMLIAHFADLPEKKMFKLIEKEYFNQKQQRVPNLKKVS